MTNTIPYIMDDPREAMRLELKVDPEAWVHKYVAHRVSPHFKVLDVGCGPGTNIVLEKGAEFGPLEAGPEGALLLEIMMGDPRAVPADPEGFAALLGEREM